MSEYSKTCDDIAAEAMDEDDPEEFIWESVDGSEWIIYTAKNIVVLQESDNASAVFDDCDLNDGDLSDCGGFVEAMAMMAFYAMRADIMEEHRRLQAEVMEEYLRLQAEVEE